MSLVHLLTYKQFVLSEDIMFGGNPSYGKEINHPDKTLNDLYEFVYSEYLGREVFWDEIKDVYTKYKAIMINSRQEPIVDDFHKVDGKTFDYMCKIVLSDNN
jgi:hypothetical protein